MKPLKNAMRAAPFISLALLTQNAWAEHEEYQCENIPKEEMKTQQELHKKLTGQGWRVRQIKVINGCYEVYGFDEKNARVEAFFHPKTLQSVQPLPVSAAIQAK